MNINFNTDDIERFLNNEMQENERANFEAALSQEADLKEAYDERKLAHDTIEIIIENNLRKELQALAKGETSTQEEAKVVPMKRRRNFLQLISVAAGVLLLIGFFAIFNDNPSRNELLGKYYGEPNFSGARGNAPQGFQIIQESIKLLEKGESENAINNLDQIKEGAEYFITAQYYKAHGYYLEGRYPDAYSAFQKVSQSGDLRYAESSDWYGLLACLQDEQNTCQGDFAKIEADDGHSFYKKANELKKSIQ